MNVTLGKRISNLRREKKLKQDDLAELLGISSQAVSKWENDQTCPDISLLPNLAKILGVSVDELLTGKNEVPDVRMLPENEKKSMGNMAIRIIIKSSDGDSIRLNLPLPIVESAIEIGLDISQVSGNETLKNIDLNKIMEIVKQGVVGKLLEMESADGDIIQIFVE